MVAQRTVNTTIRKALQNNANIYRSEKLSKTGKAANKKMILGAKFKKVLANLLSLGELGVVRFSTHTSSLLPY